MNDGTTPLSKVELTAMNTQWSRFCINSSHDNATGCAHDVPDLLAEVDRLRAELKAAKSTRKLYTPYSRCGPAEFASRSGSASTPSAASSPIRHSSGTRSGRLHVG